MPLRPELCSSLQVIQFFESWAHHLGPSQFATFAKPYADRPTAFLCFVAKRLGFPAGFRACTQSDSRVFLLTASRTCHGHSR
eukprot:2199874-Pleurochrysis_carterae.AAC.2